MNLALIGLHLLLLGLGFGLRLPPVWVLGGSACWVGLLAGLTGLLDSAGGLAGFSLLWLATPFQDLWLALPLLAFLLVLLHPAQPPEALRRLSFLPAGWVAIAALDQAQHAVGVIHLQALEGREWLAGWLLPGLTFIASYLALTLRHWPSWNGQQAIIALLLLVGLPGLVLGGVASVSESLALVTSILMLHRLQAEGWKTELLTVTLEQSLRLAGHWFGLWLAASLSLGLLHALGAGSELHRLMSTLPGQWAAALALALALLAAAALAEVTVAILGLLPLVLFALYPLQMDALWLAVTLAFALPILLPWRGGLHTRAVWISQALTLTLLLLWPPLATALPKALYGSDFSRIFAEENRVGENAIHNPHEAYIDF